MKHSAHCLRRIGGARSGDPAVIVERRVDRVSGEDAGIEASDIGRIGQAQRNADAAGVAERIVHLRAFEEADEARTGQLLKTFERFVIADRQRPRLALRRPGQNRIAKADGRIGEIHLEFVAKVAGHGSFRAQPDAADPAVETEVAGIDGVVGVFDIADIILNASTRLERPAAFLVLQQRRALPAWRDRADLGFKASSCACSASTWASRNCALAAASSGVSAAASAWSAPGAPSPCADAGDANIMAEVPASAAKKAL